MSGRAQHGVRGAIAALHRRQSIDNYMTTDSEEDEMRRDVTSESLPAASPSTACMAFPPDVAATAQWRI